MIGTEKNAFVLPYTLFHFYSQKRHYYPHFTDEITRAQGYRVQDPIYLYASEDATL